MVWFNFKVSNDLLERQHPDGRYAPWIEIYHPGEGYQYAVRAFLGLVDAIGEDCSVADRTALIDNFEIAVRYEWSFAETCWQRGTWPV
jgi:thiaminase/transcriptional activator TenA